MRRRWASPNRFLPVQKKGAARRPFLFRRLGGKPSEIVIGDSRFVVKCTLFTAFVVDSGGFVARPL